MQKQNLPIGVFDSGVGGVSVLKELVRILPNENFLYIGDSKNAPYGTKSHEEIFVHAQSCADILIEKGVKALVVACNTATSVCIENLRKKYTELFLPETRIISPMNSSQPTRREPIQTSRTVM